MLDHGEFVWDVAFSPDGSLLASGSGTQQRGDVGTVWLWDVEAGTELRRLAGHSARVLGVAVDLNGLQLASSSLDGVRLWGVQDAEE